MIRRLRRKFIAIAMLSMFLVLSVIMGAVNGINYRNITREADRVLSVLAENGGRFPKEKRPSGKKLPPPRDLSPEAPYETRFFTVTLNAEGAATSPAASRPSRPETPPSWRNAFTAPAAQTVSSVTIVFCVWTQTAAP